MVENAHMASVNQNGKDANMPIDDLGKIDPAFAGFAMRDGQIITPNGYAYPPGYLYAIPLNLQLIAELQRERRTPRQLLL